MQCSRTVFDPDCPLITRVAIRETLINKKINIEEIYSYYCWNYYCVLIISLVIVIVYH